VADDDWVVSRPSLWTRTRQTWTLLQTLTPREFRVRYRESYLDLAWAVVTPLVLLVVYGVILTQAFDADGGCAPYLSSAWVGLVLWTFFSGAVYQACNSLVGSGELISKIYFPREALPLAEVGVSLVDLALGGVTIVVVALVQGAHIGVTALAVVPALLLLIVWTSALGVLVAATTVFVRDVAHIVNLGLRAGFFATPIMYDVSFLPPELRWLAEVNPVAVAIIAVRDGLLCGTWPDWKLMGIQLVIGTVLLVLAVLYVRRYESHMVDVL
jgi:ABC-type polysaccharide/polyol phosphate export permease